MVEIFWDKMRDGEIFWWFSWTNLQILNWILHYSTFLKLWNSCLFWLKLGKKFWESWKICLISMRGLFYQQNTIRVKTPKILPRCLHQRSRFSSKRLCRDEIYSSKNMENELSSRKSDTFWNSIQTNFSPQLGIEQ